jgi:hypothetical protein
VVILPSEITLPAPILVQWYGGPIALGGVSGGAGDVGNEVVSIATRWIIVDLYRAAVSASGKANGGVALTYLSIDIDVDSDNNNHLQPPVRSLKEEQIEESSPKKVIVNSAYNDDDKIPDYADWWIAGKSFTPVVVQIPDAIPVTEMTVTFDYAASDPDAVSVIEPYALPKNGGPIRLWTKNASDVRSPLSVAQNRDPSRLVPMQVTGFEELHERRRNQLKLANDIAEFNKKALAIIQTVKDERSLQIDLRFRHYVERQQMLAHRVLKLHAAIERQHINRNERYRHDGGLEPPIEIKEENDIRRLYALEHELRRPISRLHELSSRLEQEAGRDSQLDGLPPVSRLHLDSLQEWLTRQQEAVRVLIEVSLQDLKDLDVVREIVCEMTGRNP